LDSPDEPERKFLLCGRRATAWPATRIAHAEPILVSDISAGPRRTVQCSG